MTNETINIAKDLVIDILEDTFDEDFTSEISIKIIKYLYGLAKRKLGILQKNIENPDLPFERYQSINKEIEKYEGNLKRLELLRKQTEEWAEEKNLPNRKQKSKK